MIRGFDLRRALTANWPYKVAAVVLAILLWMRVSAGQASVEQAVPTRLEVEVSDTTWTLLDVPPEVTTTFQGQGGDMFSFFFEQPRILKRVESVDDSTLTLPLSVSDVLYNRSLNVNPTSVDPDEVTIRLERRASKRVPVRVESDARATPGYFLGDVRLTPDSVTLRGPASLVSSVSEVSTEPLEVGEVSDRVSRQLVVRVPEGLRGVEVDPRSVLASVEVDSLRTRVFRVPLQITGTYAAQASVSQGTVEVSVRGGAGAIESLIPGDVMAHVEIAEPVTRERTQRVLVELPGDMAADAEAAPPLVRVSPAPGDGSRAPSSGG